MTNHFIPEVLVIQETSVSFRLYVTSVMGGTTPAGARLLKGDAPNVAFHHSDPVKAKEDATKLQFYLNKCSPVKKQR